ncbi:MAG: polyphosphate:AMP phosphotransferase [Myxococcota bacterium]
MFEAAEVDHRVSKARYEEEVPRLREALLAAQDELRDSGRFGLCVVVGGVDAAGKGATVNQLQYWLDPRQLRVHGIDRPTDEVRARPLYWRYWRLLPPRGTAGVFMGSWYTDVILKHAAGKRSDAELDTALDQVRHFERMLTDESVHVLKLWFHIPKRRVKRRLEKLAKDDATSWRVTDEDWQRLERYDAIRRSAERALRRTSTDNAPWLVVSGGDRRHRELVVGRAVLETLQRGLAAKAIHEPAPPVPRVAPAIDGRTVLDTLDLTRKVPEEVYDVRLEELQGRLARLLRSSRFRKKHSLVVAFEGQDAAGKGGSIRRVTAALDPRSYHVVRIAAPSDEEKALPYLWRFWRHVPARGRTTLYDRSWYGRVLVERVEGFASKADWARAYAEINDFEEQLHDHGAVLVKLWLQIDPQEQLRRFREREQIGHKRHKITAEDWRNREKWDQYAEAVHEMVVRTSTELAPWTLVAANDKRHARLTVLETLTRALEARLG